MPLSSNRYWLIVPAAGAGKRMQSHCPKQYLTLGEKPVIDHTLQRLLASSYFSDAYVGLSPEDEYWSACQSSRNSQVHTFPGGAERVHTVLNGLKSIAENANKNDWVLVHDVARPCITQDDLKLLISSLNDHSVGGILASPVVDTIKQVNHQLLIEKTVDRNHLWRAYTPQMFRFGLLKDALEQALSDGFIVTDEASAIEHVGLIPQVVVGRSDNIKITQPGDLELAAFLMSQQNVSIMKNAEEL